MDKNSLIIRIENLRIWKSNNWVKYNTKMCDAFLRLHFDQLLITSENKVLESINLCSKLKGVYKQDYVILIVNIAPSQVRKIKFQIKDNMEQNLKVLAKKFPLVAYNNISSRGNTFTPKFQSTEDILSGLLDKEDIMLPSLPRSPALDQLVKLCILDPQFPKTVMEIQRAIENEMSHKN